MITLVIRIQNGGPTVERQVSNEIQDAVANIDRTTGASIHVVSETVTSDQHIVYRPAPGFVECPGSFMGNHKNVRSSGHGKVADCQYCGNTIRTIQWGSHLKRHWAEGRQS